MNDLATLGIAVDSSPAAKAATDLDKMTSAAERAEDAVVDLGSKSSTALKEVGKGAASLPGALKDVEISATGAGKAASGMVSPQLINQMNQFEASLRTGAKSTAELEMQRSQLRNLQKSSMVDDAEAIRINKQLDKVQQDLTKSALQEEKALDQLMRSIDPTSAKMAKLERETEQLGKAFDKGEIGAEEYARALTALDGRVAKLGAANDPIIQTTGAMGKLGLGSRQAREDVMQLGNALASGDWAGAARNIGQIGAEAGTMAGRLALIVAPIALVIAAVAALSYGYMKGSSESTEFNKALELTGSYAGVSAQQLGEMSRQVSATVGTTGQAAEALAALAKNGKIAGESFLTITEAAVGMKEGTGKAISDTIAEFVKLADEPVSASAALNEQYHYLTASVYAQIAALELQGDHAGAVKLATETYADAINDRTPRILENLSLWEKGYNLIAKAADNLKNIGRRDIDSEIAQAQSDLDQANAGDVGLFQNKQVMIDYYDNKLNMLRDEKAANADIARYQSEQDVLNQKSITAMGKVDALTKSAWTNEQKRTEELKEYSRWLDDIRKKNPTDQRLNQATIDQNIANIKEKNKDPAAAAGALDLTAFNDAKNRIAAITAEYQNMEKEIDAAHTAGIYSDQSYMEQKGAILQQQQVEINAAYQAEIDALEAAKARKSTTAAQGIQLDQKIADVRASMVKSQMDSDSKLAVLAVNEEGRLKKQAAAIDNYVQALNDQLAQTKQQLAIQSAGVGMGDEARKRLQDDIKIQQDYQDKLDKLLLQRNKNAITQEVYDRQTDALRSTLDERLQLQKDYYSAVEAEQSNWLNGATSAYQTYLEEVRNVAGLTKSAFLNAFDGLEDVLVSFVTNGKASFKDFVNSILADIARIVLKTQIIGPLLSTLGLSDSSGGSGGGVFSSITGGGGGNSVTSLIGSAKTVMDVASSKFAESVMNGWNAGGESIVDSITGAFDGGASYVGDAISSAFTAGSATASVAAEATAQTFSAGITESATAIGSQFSAEIGGAALSYEAAAAASSTALSSTLGALSTALSVIGTAYTIFTSFQDYGIEGGLTTAGFAAAGAAIGTYVFPVIGTAIGAAIGAALGAIGAASWFGGPNYEQLVSSAEGSYSGGQFKDEGWYDGWKENKTRVGGAADNQLMSYVQQFTSTLGMLYDALGDGSDVSAALTMRRRETSGDWSNGMAATLDSGEQITALRQYGLDVDANLTEYYDDVMGTFLAQAIVKSESLPAYFKAQFTQFADDWDVTAETVIAAIEGVFTRFNGVNSALSQINVGNLKLNESGMIASDSILNMVASLADLDAESATAKEKVDALNELVNSYYSAFFSAGEQFDSLTNTLTGSFAGFGLELPDNRDAYRAMVEDIDVTTSAGQAMFATMMGLATAADSYYKTIAQRESAYRSAFLSESEQTAFALKETTDQLKALGVTLPGTRAEYRSMVEAAAKDTSAAGKALYDSLMSVAEEAGTAFDAMEAAARSSAQAITDALTGAVTNANSALSRAVEAERDAATKAYNARVASLNDMATTASQSVNELTSMSSSLESALKSLNGTSDDAVKTLRAQAQATLQSALATARAGGSLAGFTGLEDALSTVSDNNTDLYSSMEDFARDQGRTANVVAELNAINGKQLTAAEKLQASLETQIDQAKEAYDAQMAQFDAQLDFAQAQIDALNGVDNSVLSVVDAVNAMNAAVVAALSTVKSATPTNAGTLIDTVYNSVLGRDADKDGKQYWQGQVSSGAVGYDQLAGAIKNAATENAIKNAYSSVLGQTADAAGAAYWASQVSSGALSVSQLEQAIKNAAVANGSIPAYATGGDHMGGLRLVGENGPELEVTGPSRIFNANQTAAMLKGGGDSGMTAAEVRELRREMQSNATYMAQLTKEVADGIDTLVNSGVQIVGTVNTKAAA